MSKRIAVLGAGAIGSSVGADLSEAGEDVLLLDQWPAHVEAMRTGGLRVVMPGKDLRMKVRALHLGELATERPAFDVVLLAAKSYDTVWMCHLIAPYLADDGVFVGLQNGMNEEMITPIVGSERTIACVVELSAEIWQPGWCSATPPGTGPGSRWASSTERSPSGPRKWPPCSGTPPGWM